MVDIYLQTTSVEVVRFSRQSPTENFAAKILYGDKSPNLTTPPSRDLTKLRRELRSGNTKTLPCRVSINRTFTWLDETHQSCFIIKFNNYFNKGTTFLN